MSWEGPSFEPQAVAEVCKRYQVQELAVFGSALRDDFRPESDIDVLVDFKPEASVGFLALAGLQVELAALFGRRVDLVPKRGLKPLIRDQVLSSARVFFRAA